MKQLIQKLNEKFNELQKKKKSREKILIPKADLVRSNNKEASAKPIDVQVGTLEIVKILIVSSLFLALSNIFVVIKSIVLVTIFSVIISAGLSPMVSRMESWHIPRPLAIILLYIIFISVVSISLVVIAPIFFEQLINMFADIVYFLNEKDAGKGIFQIIEKAISIPTNEIQSLLTQNIREISQSLNTLASSTVNVIGNIFYSFFYLIFALVLTFFILLEQERIAHFCLLLFPKKSRKYIKNRFLDVQNKFAKWFRAQVILMFSVGIMMYIGLKIFSLIFGMKYAGAIALLAGMLELFPYIGVFITSIVVSITALNISFLMFVIAMLWMIGVQFIEGNILVPIIMEKIVGLPAVVILLAVAIGGTLGAALGGIPLAILSTIFSIPIAASLSIFVNEYIDRRS